MADLDRVHAWLKGLVDGFLREECWFGTVALVGNQNLTPMPDLLEAFVAWAQADPNVPSCEQGVPIGDGLYQRFTGQVLSLARAMLEMRATRGGYRYIDRLGGSVLCVNIVVRDKGAGFRGEEEEAPGDVVEVDGGTVEIRGSSFDGEHVKLSRQGFVDLLKVIAGSAGIDPLDGRHAVTMRLGDTVVTMAGDPDKSTATTNASFVPGGTISMGGGTPSPSEEAESTAGTAVARGEYQSRPRHDFNAHGVES